MKWWWGRRHAWWAAVMITSCKCQGLWTCLWRSNKMCTSRSWAWRWLRMTGWAIARIIPWFWWITSLTSHGCIFNRHKHRMGWCILWSKVLSSWGWIRRKLIIKAVHCRWCTTWWISQRTCRYQRSYRERGTGAKWRICQAGRGGHVKGWQGRCGTWIGLSWPDCLSRERAKATCACTSSTVCWSIANWNTTIRYNWKRPRMRCTIKTANKNKQNKVTRYRYTNLSLILSKLTYSLASVKRF